MECVKCKDLEKIVSKLKKYKKFTLVAELEKIIEGNKEERGYKSLKLLKQLQKILPKGWSLNEAFKYWKSLKGEVLSQKIKYCIRKPPKNLPISKEDFCEYLGKSVTWLGANTNQKGSSND